MGNTVAVEVANMLAAAWLMLSSLFYSLQLSSGSFPRPLTEEEERYYLDLAGKGDLEARNVLIEWLTKDQSFCQGTGSQAGQVRSEGPADTQSSACKTRCCSSGQSRSCSSSQG